MNMTSKILDPVIPKQKAIEAAGNAASLARLLGISRASVSGWGEFVPPYQAYRLIQIFPALNEASLAVSSNVNPGSPGSFWR